MQFKKPSLQNLDLFSFCVCNLVIVSFSLKICSLIYPLYITIYILYTYSINRGSIFILKSFFNCFLPDRMLFFNHADIAAHVYTTVLSIPGTVLSLTLTYQYKCGSHKVHIYIHGI